MAEEPLLNNPYETITNYAEELYPNSGEKIFKYLTLQPCSLIMPPMKYKGREKRSTIHILVLGKAGMAKSCMNDLYNEIALNPLNFKRKTAADLREHLYSYYEDKKVTLMTDDVSRIMKDFAFMKMMEGVMEEQKVSDDTRKDGRRNFKVYGTFLAMGVYSDLTGNLSSGGLSRMNPIIFNHDLTEQEEIGVHISENLMREDKTDATQLELIKQHYKTLYGIQEGKNKDFPKITGMIFGDSQRRQINSVWKKMIIEKICKTQEETETWYRDEEDAFRFANASAMLNLKNRKVETEGDQSRIVITNEDAKLAALLMGQEIITKYNIIKTEGWREKLIPFGRISQALQGVTTPTEVVRKLNQFKEENTNLFKDEAHNPPQPHNSQRQGRPSQE